MYGTIGGEVEICAIIQYNLWSPRYAVKRSDGFVFSELFKLNQLELFERPPEPAVPISELKAIAFYPEVNFHKIYPDNPPNLRNELQKLINKYEDTQNE